MPASCASLCLNPCCACDQALLLLQGLVGHIPLQPFRCILQGLLHFLRRGDDLHRCGQIASGAVRVAVAAGEGKAHGAWGFRRPSLHRRPIWWQGLAIKRGAGKRGVDELVAQLRGAFVGDLERGELLAMGGQFFREIGETEDQRAGGGRVDAAGRDGARFGRRRAARAAMKRPFLKVPRALGRNGSRLGGRAGGAAS